MKWLSRFPSLVPPKGVVALALVFADGHEGSELSKRIPQRRRYFEIGSLTKTLTSTVLADLCSRGVVELDTTLDDLLGARSGAAGSVTLRQLATHTSGLPRLAPNAMALPFWPRDPYRFFTRERLIAALQAVSLSESGSVYSNFGYDVLALALEEAAQTPFRALVAERVFLPAGMSAARCQPGASNGMVRGHGSLMLGGRRWHKPTPGSGGVDFTVEDLVAWCRVNLSDPGPPLAEAIAMAHRVHYEDDATTVGLAWRHQRGMIWHNGATGAFQSAIVVVPGAVAAGAMASFGAHADYDLSRELLAAVESVSGGGDDG